MGENRRTLRKTCPSAGAATHETNIVIKRRKLGFDAFLPCALPLMHIFEFQGGVTHVPKQFPMPILSTPTEL
jgi:hypothetical protein